MSLVIMVRCNTKVHFGDNVCQALLHVRNLDVTNLFVAEREGRERCLEMWTICQVVSAPGSSLCW